MAQIPSSPDFASRASLVTASPTIVACIGSSSTAGKGQAFNWIAELARRPRNKNFRFLNFGVGGDLAYNLLERLPAAIACHPDRVMVLIGANDVLALVSPRFSRFARIWKHSPRDPSPAWFRENLQSIAQRLQSETSASVGFCSLFPIGEDPVFENRLQRELNRYVAEYSAMIAEVAREQKAAYIAVHEAMIAQILQSPGRAFTSFRFLSFYRDAFRVLVLRKSTDEVAEMNGWRFHTDGVHLNSSGGMIVADLVQEFLDTPAPSPL